MLNIFDVLVELWINRHMFGSHCKSLAMLLSAADVKHEWNKVWVFGHHFLQEGYRQVNTFHNKRFVALLILVDDF